MQVIISMEGMGKYTRIAKGRSRNEKKSNTKYLDLKKVELEIHPIEKK